MPAYDYKCSECGAFEAVHPMDEKVEECPECGKPVKRLYAAPAASYRGSGWTKATTVSSESVASSDE